MMMVTMILVIPMNFVPTMILTGTVYLTMKTLVMEKDTTYDGNWFMTSPPRRWVQGWCDDILLRPGMFDVDDNQQSKHAS